MGRDKEDGSKDKKGEESDDSEAPPKKRLEGARLDGTGAAVPDGSEGFVSNLEEKLVENANKRIDSSLSLMAQQFNETH